MLRKGLYVVFFHKKTTYSPFRNYDFINFLFVNLSFVYTNFFLTILSTFSFTSTALLRVQSSCKKRSPLSIVLARPVFFVLLGLSVALLSCSKDRPVPAAPASKSLASLAAPAAPTNLRFDAPTDSSCTVRWDASDGATDYDVNYKPAEGGKWTNEPHRGIGLSNTIDDLQPNTEYRWAVRAENSDGTSAWVFGPNFTTLADSVAPSAGAPDPPTNLRIDQLTATSVRVRWDASDGATDYDVNYKAVGGRWTNEPHRGTQLYNIIEGLEPNTEYQWAVRAENSAGTSTWVHADNFTTLPDSTSSSDSSSASSGSDSSPSDGVFIPDTALRTYIEKELNKNPGETIKQAEMETLDFLLGGDNLGIKNLRGLEAAKNLRQLSLSNNEISDLTPLANLTQLRYLPLRDNQISDLTPLANLTQLNYLSLDRNKKISDLTPLANLDELKEVSFADNRVSDLTPLANLTKLRWMHLAQNRISDLTPLANLTQLRDLFLRSNEISDLTPLANLTQLNYLSLPDNEISDLTPLANLTQLRELFLFSNRISDLTPLANLDKLIRLNLRSNEISDLTPLANLTQLRDLFLRSNEISDLTPLANLTRLNYLSLDDNQISDLTPLADLTQLRELDISGNQVSDLSPLTALASPPLGIRVLKAWNNPLSEASINEHIPALQSSGVDVSFSSSIDTGNPFSIDLVFLGDSTVEEQEILRHTAKRWEVVIQTELPNYTFPDAWSGTCGEHSIEIPAGEQIDDLRIYVTRFPGKDAWRRPAGSGAPSLLRSSSLPIIGCVQFNFRFIVSDTQVRHPLWGVGFHEIGHVLGIGTIWDDSGMLRGLNADAHFAGPQAIAAFDQAGGTDYQGAKVPTEQDGAHWRSSVLSGEIMVPSFSSVDALSAITLQALSDLGYSVDLSEADPYVLPSPTAAKPVADELPFCSLEGQPAPVYADD